MSSVTSCSCTMKAKVVVFKRALKESEQKDLTGQTDFLQGTRLFLQLLHVETGNVLTDMPSTVWIKHVKPWSTVLSNTDGYNISFCSNHNKSLCFFGCKASGFNHRNRSIVWFSSLSAAFTVCMKAFHLLLYWTLPAREQKSYFWKITDHRLVVH